jgi:hypothetical protein
MKIPIHCPKCGDILLNEEVFKVSNVVVWRKSCTKRLGHKFAAYYNIDDSELSGICIQIVGNTEAHWDFKNNLLSVNKNAKTLKDRLESTKLIPYFEPDLSNYKKLVSKMKTYILFL